jgi:hypothetical protein
MNYDLRGFGDARADIVGILGFVAFARSRRRS